MSRRGRRRPWRSGSIVLSRASATPAAASARRSRSWSSPGRGGPTRARGATDATTGDLLCFLLASTTTLEPGLARTLACAVDGDERVVATPLVVHPLRRIAATPHDGRVRARGLGLGVVRDAPAIRDGAERSLRVGAAPVHGRRRDRRVPPRRPARLRSPPVAARLRRHRHRRVRARPGG